MTTMQKAEQLLREMTQAEKAQLLQLLARDLSGNILGITSTPGIGGGAPRIVGTRIPLWVLVGWG